MTFFQTIAQTSTLQIINKNKKHLYLKWIRRFLWCFKEKCKHSFNWHNFILPLISELLFFLRAHGILCPHNNTHIHTHTHTHTKKTEARPWHFFVWPRKRGHTHQEQNLRKKNIVRPSKNTVQKEQKKWN